MYVFLYKFTDDSVCLKNVFVNHTNRYYWRARKVKSVGYPKNYTNNQDCVWIIQTGKNFRLSFNIDFQIEETSSCSADKIELYDG